MSSIRARLFLAEALTLMAEGRLPELREPIIGERPPQITPEKYGVEALSKAEAKRIRKAQRRKA